MRVQDVIRRPLITEKSTLQRDDTNTVAFEVDRKANKIDVKRAVEAQFKVKVALAAAKVQKTITELSQEYKVHPTQIIQWKKQFMDSLPEIFSVRRKKEEQEQELLTNELYQQIGQLKVELDWLKKKSGHDT